MPTPLLAAQNLCFRYPHRPPLLRNAAFELHVGERVGLIGANGSGKTTLLRLLTGLLAPTSGTIYLHGEPITTEPQFRRLRQRVGFCLQHAEDQLFYPVVLEDVAFGPLNLGLSPEKARLRAESTLARLHITDLAQRLTHRLSGGEMRLVALAGILAMEPELLLLDEPTTGLDPATRERLMGILRHLPTAALIVSHDWDFLEATCQRFLFLDDGGLHEETQLFPHTHTHAHPRGQTPHHHP